MEPADFDKIIQEKLSENNESHAHDIESSKPFVWSAVQRQTGNRHALRWYHLAAAIVLMVISFGFVLNNVQKSYSSKIDVLSERIEGLQGNYLTQEEQIKVKNSEFASLGNELKVVEKQLVTLKNQPRVETIIYQTDTVYIKQVEYVTVVEHEPSIVIEAIEVVESVETETISEIKTQTEKTIYPSHSYASNNKTETLKLKFGTFASKN